MTLKRFLVLLCFLLTAFGASSAWASSPGNPLVLVGQGRLAVSAEWEQQNRNLKLDVDSDVISNRYWLKGAYGLYDWLDLCGAIGMVEFDVTMTEGTRSYSYESRHLTFGFSGGLRMRAFYDEQRDISGFLSVNGAYMKTTDFVGARQPSEMIWDEIQLSGTVGKTYGFATPYVGLSYFLVDGNMEWVSSGSQDFRDPGGLAFVGIDFTLPSFYRLSFEVASRLGGESDEISFSLGFSQRSK